MSRMEWECPTPSTLTTLLPRPNWEEDPFQRQVNGPLNMVQAASAIPDVKMHPSPPNRHPLVLTHTPFESMPAPTLCGDGIQSTTSHQHTMHDSRVRSSSHTKAHNAHINTRTT